MRLDGDIILQQSEVLHWQAEGAGSLEEIRSVCSCTCNSCNPFQQISHRYHEDHIFKQGGRSQANGPIPGERPRAGVKGAGRPSGRHSAASAFAADWRAGRWASQNSMHSQLALSERGETPTTTLDDYCDYRDQLRRNKADSVHDLRRSTLSSALRLPPSTPPHLKRPASRAKSCCIAAQAAAAAAAAAGSRCRLSEDGSKTDLMSSLRDFNIGDPSLSYGVHSQSRRPQGGRGFFGRLFPWTGEGATSATFLEAGTETEKRESYALDEVDSLTVVPRSKNVNHHKRVSL